MKVLDEIIFDDDGTPMIPLEQPFYFRVKKQEPIPLGGGFTQLLDEKSDYMQKVLKEMQANFNGMIFPRIKIVKMKVDEEEDCDSE